VTEKTILIADDDHELVHALAVRCRRLGLNVLCAHDAFSALSLVKTGRPHVVCLDVEMPAGNGLSVCEMLSSDAACRTIPIMILTGRTDPETIMRCHSLCAYYVEKCPDVWSRIEPLLKELLCDHDTASTSHPVEPGEPAAHNSLHRG
jgi:DNA-binding response OmpR family regulator